MQGPDVAIIGAGHAGLAMSNVLRQHDVDHIVLERDRVAARWRTQRWDSFTLLTPNWATWLPQWHYDGPDPHGFMVRGETVSYFERYARAFDAPVREQVEVLELAPADAGGYRLSTTAGDLVTNSVVVATGPFQLPRLPTWATSLPQDVAQVHSSSYRAPAALPSGAVLVVGAGPSGQQIAEDLLRGGRSVFLSVGRHRRVPRCYRGRDYYWWLEHGGFYERTAEDVPARQRRDPVAPVLTGFGGGHDLDLRRLHADGAHLLGRATGCVRNRVQVHQGLTATLTAGDRAYVDFTEWVESRLYRFAGLFEPHEPDTRASEPPESPSELDLAGAGITSVVWATGFRTDFARWVRMGVLDESGFPIHHRGVTDAPGLYFLGLPWLHRLRSPFIRGAAEDAGHIAAHLAAHLAAAA